MIISSRTVRLFLAGLQTSFPSIGCETLVGKRPVLLFYFLSTMKQFSLVPHRLLATCLVFLVFGWGVLFSSASHGQERSGVGLSIQATTMGPGVGIHVGLTESLRLQARGSFLPYSTTQSIEDDAVDTQIDADLRIGGPEVRLDWHPFTSAFHLSVGGLYNLAEADGQIVPTSSYEFSDDKTFSPEDIGKMDATVSYSLPVSPYLGLGFGDELSGQWSFVFELGAYYAGSPEVDLEGTNLIKPTERNEDVLEKGFESFQFIPHLAFGLSYQF